MRSMTGFGRGTLEDENQSFIVEMKSVNHRYCDLNIKIPKSLMLLEDKIRKVILQRINRGKVDIIVTQRSSDSRGIKAVLDEGLADSYIMCFNRIKERYNIKDNISLNLMAKFPDIITLKKEEEDIEYIWGYLSRALNDALLMLIDMREKEGEKLKEDLSKKCTYIKNLILEIENDSPKVLEDYKSKLSQKLNNLLEDYPVDESRVAMEIALFADKSSIDEEIVRLKSHIVQFQKNLDANGPVGRKLDFILQEMNREANTIASKSTNLNITRSILDIKNEVEKIREQIQNVE